MYNFFIVIVEILDKTLYKDINTSTLDLLVNVFSGRKSSKNNMLVCGIIEGNPKDMASRNTIVFKLIRE